MDKISGIYCIENKITNKKYIGKSVDIIKRWNEHKSLLNRNVHENTYLQHAWNKYGEYFFDFYILEECNKQELNEKEIMYISKYNTTNRMYGYNRTPGGTGGNTICTYSEEQLIEYKKRKSKILKGRHLVGENSPNAKLTNSQVIEIIQMILDGKYDDEIAIKYNVSEKTINDIRNHKKWLHLTDGIEFPKIKRRFNDRNETIVQYDLDGNFICRYASLVDLKKTLGLNTSLISQVCRGIRKTAYGYVFRFNEDPFDKFDHKKHSSRLTSVDQYDLDYNLIATYPSVAEAERVIGVRIDGAIYTNKKYTAGGFYWSKHGEIPLYMLEKENKNV